MMNRRGKKPSASPASSRTDFNHQLNSTPSPFVALAQISSLSNLDTPHSTSRVHGSTSLDTVGVIPAMSSQARVSIAQVQSTLPSNSYGGGQGGSRRSSIQSFQDISEPPTDESDDDDQPGDRSLSFRERRREAHTQSEQKRRDAIKKGYQELEQELPNVKEEVGGQKPSKAVVLQKSIDYLMFLEEQKKKQADELESLKRDLLGLQIMKQTYDKMAANFKNLPDEGETPVSDEVKFFVYQEMMDRLFLSFDARVTVSSFADLSGSAFNWLEESCTPPVLHQITKAVLSTTKNSPPNLTQP